MRAHYHANSRCRCTIGLISVRHCPCLCWNGIHNSRTDPLGSAPLAYFKPAHGANYEVLELFGKNRLTVTRQAPCHPTDNRTLDMALAVNGLPVTTIELKNPGTGQNWRHAVRQFKEDRDARAPLFEFKKRALVHFAADPDEVHMTTRLAGEKTHFLPLNRGSHPGQIVCGAGNPQDFSDGVMSRIANARFAQPIWR